MTKMVKYWYCGTLRMIVDGSIVLHHRVLWKNNHVLVLFFTGSVWLVALFVIILAQRMWFHPQWLCDQSCVQQLIVSRFFQTENDDFVVRWCISQCRLLTGWWTFLARIIGCCSMQKDFQNRAYLDLECIVPIWKRHCLCDPQFPQKFWSVIIFQVN